MKPLNLKLTKYKSIAIIGMAKNVGKTTLLNYMLKKAKGHHTLGLTSIGRDGEGTDLVTGTEKPEIYVCAGTLMATAHSLLNMSDITLEIIEPSGIMTPMGEIVIVKALSDGYIQLAGPSINSNLKIICDRLVHYGSDVVLCDGAMSRKTSASPAITDAAILSTGASVHADMRKVIDDTVHAVSLMGIGSLDNESIRRNLEDNTTPRVMTIDRHEQRHILPVTTALGSMDTIIQYMDNQSEYLLIRGVVTDSMMHQLASIENKSITLVVEDATKLLISRHAYERFVVRSREIKVLHKINLIAVSINPISPYGYSFDSNDFYEKLSCRISIPVINVCHNP